MLCHFQSRKPFLRDLENRGSFLAHIGFGVVVAGLKQFGSLLLVQGDVESFGHGESFLVKQVFYTFYHMPLTITNLIF